MAATKPNGRSPTEEISLAPLDEPFKQGSLSSPRAPGNRTQEVSHKNSEQKSNLVTPLERLGEEPAYIDCPYCEKRTQTKVEQNNSSQTTLAAFLCCLCGGVITVCIPFLCHWCADIDHRCSECGKQVSHKPYDGEVQARYPTGPIQQPSKYAAMPAQQRAKLELPPVEPQPTTSELIVATPPEKAKTSGF